MTYQTPPPDERPLLRIGMLGYGFMGKAHSNALLTLPYIFHPRLARTQLHAIAGRTEDQVAAAATRYGWQHFTTDWHDLVEDADIDVFANVAADAAHHEPTLAAIRAGKHVVCEKPLSNDVSEAIELEQAAAEAGVKHLTCFNYRFMPAVRLAHELIRSGELGEIYSASFRYAQEWRTEPTGDLPTRTGALDVIGCHAVDQARFLIGEVESVSAMITDPVTTPDRGEPIDTVTALASLGDGVPATIAATLVAPGRKNQLSWEINGSKGSVAWDLEQLNLLRYHRRGNGALEGFSDVIACEADHPLVGPWWPSAHILGWEHGHINMWAHFIESIVKDSDPAPYAATFVDGAAAARVAAAIRQAATTGERVSVRSIA